MPLVQLEMFVLWKICSFQSAVFGKFNHDFHNISFFFKIETLLLSSVTVEAFVLLSQCLLNIYLLIDYHFSRFWKIVVE